MHLVRSIKQLDTCLYLLVGVYYREPLHGISFMYIELPRSYLLQLWFADWEREAETAASSIM